MSADQNRRPSGSHAPADVAKLSGHFEQFRQQLGVDSDRNQPASTQRHDVLPLREPPFHRRAVEPLDAFGVGADDFDRVLDRVLDRRFLQRDAGSRHDATAKRLPSVAIANGSPSTRSNRTPPSA